MSHPTALIAEDEPLLARALQQELARLWPALKIVTTVDNGPDACDALLATAPDVAFLDIRMPGMTGIEVARAMAEDWPAGRPAPLVVFVTSFLLFRTRTTRGQILGFALSFCGVIVVVAQSRTRRRNRVTVTFVRSQQQSGGFVVVVVLLHVFVVPLGWKWCRMAGPLVVGYPPKHDACVPVADLRSCCCYTYGWLVEWSDL